MIGCLFNKVMANQKCIKDRTEVSKSQEQFKGLQQSFAQESYALNPSEQ